MPWNYPRSGYFLALYTFIQLVLNLGCADFSRNQKTHNLRTWCTIKVKISFDVKYHLFKSRLAGYLKSKTFIKTRLNMLLSPTLPQMRNLHHNSYQQSQLLSNDAEQWATCWATYQAAAAAVATYLKFLWKYAISANVHKNIPVLCQKHCWDATVTRSLQMGGV